MSDNIQTSTTGQLTPCLQKKTDKITYLVKIKKCEKSTDRNGIACFCLFSFEGMWVCVLVIVFCVLRFTTMFPVCFAEPLEVYNFPRAKEFDWFTDFLIVNEP